MMIVHLRLGNVSATI